MRMEMLCPAKNYERLSTVPLLAQRCLLLVYGLAAKLPSPCTLSRLTAKTSSAFRCLVRGLLCRLPKDSSAPALSISSASPHRRPARIALRRFHSQRLSRANSLSVAALAFAIRHVVLVRSHEQVLQFVARSIVAVVTNLHSFRYGAKGHCPSYAMHSLESAIDIDVAVTDGVTATSPDKTITFGLAATSEAFRKSKPISPVYVGRWIAVLLPSLPVLTTPATGNSFCRAVLNRARLLCKATAERVAPSTFTFVVHQANAVCRRRASAASNGTRWRVLVGHPQMIGGY